MAQSPNNGTMKRKNIDNTLNGRPQKRDCSELFNPTMVTIVVSQAAVSDSHVPVPTEEFAIPRGLICHHSKYFESAFERQWIESDARRLELDDVSPRVFRVFVTWLYFQKIFREETRMESAIVVIRRDNADSHDETTPLGTALVASRSRQQDDPEHGISTGSDEPQYTVFDDGIHDSDGEILPFREANHTDDDVDAADPNTWTWIDMFELYIFTQKVRTLFEREAIGTHASLVRYSSAAYGSVQYHTREAYTTVD